MIIIDTYYGYTGKLRESLSLENLKTGTSLLCGKVGQQIFSTDLTVFHDVSDKNSWMNTFWDGDCVVPKGDKVVFIKNGKVIRGYCDKTKAKKYKVKTTGNAVSVKTPTPKKQNESNVKYMPWRKLWHEHFTQMKKK